MWHRAKRLLPAAVLAFAVGLAAPAHASEQSERLRREAAELLRANPPNTAEALIKLRAATAADAGDAPAWMLRGGVALIHFEPREALDALDRAEKLDPRLRHLQYVRGRALYELERYPDALAAFDQEPDKDRIPSFRFYRGLASKLVKDYPEALADFDKSDRVFEAGRQATQLHRGDIYAAQRELEKARAAYQAAASPDPNHPSARIAAIRLRALDAAAKGKDGAKPSRR